MSPEIIQRLLQLPRQPVSSQQNQQQQPSAPAAARSDEPAQPAAQGAAPAPLSNPQAVLQQPRVPDRRGARRHVGRGLQNESVLCFFNSLMQTLLHQQPIRAALAAAAPSSQSPLVASLAGLAQLLHEQDSVPVDPVPTATEMALAGVQTLPAALNQSVQQDVLELLLSLGDCLRPLGSAANPLTALEVREWPQRACSVCQARSSGLEYSSSVLSLPLPAGAGWKMSLQVLLQTYQMAEQLPDLSPCGQCGMRQPMLRTLYLRAPGPLLAVGVKRFDNLQRKRPVPIELPPVLTVHHHDK